MGGQQAIKQNRNVNDLMEKEKKKDIQVFVWFFIWSLLSLVRVRIVRW